MSPIDPGCRVTVVIKALNEQAGIARAIASALAAVAEVGGEVVLADSGSTDRTLDIASAYPIRIVQLRDPRERSCGAGVQLGWQHARGEYVYVMDGDMEMMPGFLEEALAVLALHPEVAGVGGRVVERNLASLEYRERQARVEPHRAPGAVDRLDGGALYRRLAIDEVGYLADRNLHSYEEFELAVRLRHRGWKLWRSPLDAVSHRGHADLALCLLLARWRSGYAWGGGELLRSALGQPWLRLVLRDLRELRLYALVWLWWLALAAVTLGPAVAGGVAGHAMGHAAGHAAGHATVAGAAAGGRAALAWRAGLAGALLLAPVLAMAWRKRSWARGGYSVLSWCVQAAGLARGLLRRRQSPRQPLASRILREPHEPTLPGDGGAGRAWLRPTPPSAQRS